MRCSLGFVVEFGRFVHESPHDDPSVRVVSQVNSLVSRDEFSYFNQRNVLFLIFSLARTVTSVCSNLSPTVTLEITKYLLATMCDLRKFALF